MSNLQFAIWGSEPQHKRIGAAFAGEGARATRVFAKAEG